VVVGDCDVGKATIRRKYLGMGFSLDYSTVLGTDFAVKESTIDQDTVISQIWEFNCSSRFQYLQTLYSRGTSGLVLVFDITRPPTLDSLQIWIADVVKSNKNLITPLLLIGTHSDLRGGVVKSVSRKSALQFAKELSDWSGYKTPYIEMSLSKPQDIEEEYNSFLKNVIQSKLSPVHQMETEDEYSTFYETTKD
jgi:Ras-related protein Rab-1A